MNAERTLVIGLGNPILGDDGVGWVVAGHVEREAKGAGLPVEVDYLSLGGLSLMERLVGYRRVILIDSLCTGRQPPGAVRSFRLEELDDPAAGHSVSVHDTTLMTALETGRRMGLPLPERIEVVAIEARHVYDFSEELTPDVASAVPEAMNHVLHLLREHQTEGTS